MLYEYDFEEIKLSDEQKRLVEMGIGNIEELNLQVKEIINKRAKMGWEPLYPFAVPQIWFRKNVRKKV